MTGKGKKIPSGKITAADLTIAATKGDRFSKRVFEHTGEILGAALANAVLHTGPRAIFIAGGLAEAGDLLFRPTIRHFEKNLFPVYRNKVKILPSRFDGNKAALLGAASLAWEIA
jgi:glucokinase